MSATEWIERLGEHVAKLETENRDLRVALRSSARECKACGAVLPNGAVLDAIESAGVDIRSQLGSETLMRWSVGYCSTNCWQPQLFRVLNGGDKHDG